MAEAAPWGAPQQSETPPWGSPEPQEGLLAKGVGMLGTSEGRGQLLQGVTKFPADLLKGTLDWFETPGKAAKEGLTPAEEISFGLNTALGTVGSKTIPRGPVEAIAPIAKQFDDGIIAPAAQRLDSYARVGDPDGVRLEPPTPETVPAPIRPIEGSPFAGIPRSVAAKTGIPEVDLVLNSPVTKAVIDNPVVDRSHDVPYMAGASDPINNPTVFVDRHVPKEQTIGGITFDPADPWVVHENVEQHTMDILIKAGMDDETAYKVAHFNFAEPAEQAWYRAHGIDQVAAEKEQMTWLPKIQGENTGGDVPASLYQKPYPHDHVPNIDHEPVTETKPTPEETARGYDIIRNAPELQQRNFLIGGPPKITLTKTDTVAGEDNRYEIQGEDGKYIATARISIDGDTATVKNIFAGNVNPALLEGKELQETLAETRNILGPRIIREVLRQFREQHPEVKNVEGLRVSGARQGGGYDAGNEIPVRLSLQEALQQARELGVIGDDRAAPSLNELPPKEAGRAAMAAGRPPDKVTGEVAKPEQTEWRKRWERTLDNMATRDDVRQVIGGIVDANDEFAAARIGDMRPVQIEQIASVTGLDSTKIDVAGTSSKIKSDVELRNFTEAFRTINDKIAAAADELRAKRGIDDSAEGAALMQLELQRQLMLDSTVAVKGYAALRAEWGRAGNTLRDFQKSMRDAAGVEKIKGIDDLRERAKLIAEAPAAARPRILVLSPFKPMPWYYWTVQNLLISGPITHAGYSAVNGVEIMLDHVIAPFGQQMLNKVRGAPADFGAPLEAYNAIVRSVPHAFQKAVLAFKSGQRVPLLSEWELAKRQLENPEAEGAQVPYTSTSGPEWGLWKKVFNDEQLAKAERVIGVFGRSANFQHTFFKFMGESAATATEAYKAAAREGLSPSMIDKEGNTQFWSRYQYHTANLSDEALTRVIDSSYEGTFMEKLGEQTRVFSELARNTPLKWVFMFTHIPMNIARAGVRYSWMAAATLPVEASRIGSALRGELGVEAQNLALVKASIGTAVGTYFINLALSGQSTGDYPTDEKERNRWKIMGIQPNSVLVNGQWQNLERLGPVMGAVPRLAANYAAIIKQYEGDQDESLMKAAFLMGLGTAKVITDDVGFQTVRNLVNAIENPKEAAKEAAYQAASYLDPFTMGAQLASEHDPFMREADTVLRGIMMRTPYAREELMPKRDPLYGEPVPNPGYHAAPFRSAPVNTDAVKSELDRLKYYPEAPQRTIGHVKLNDDQYDRYEATAGPLVKQMLAKDMQTSLYQNASDAQKAARAKGIIEYARAKARMALQMDAAHLIRQGIDNRTRQITGTVSTGATP
jgi:hypothetical protein